MHQELRDYIECHLLKKGETLELLENGEDNAAWIDLQIVKRTRHTYRKIGLFTVARNNGEQTSPDEVLLKKRFKHGTKLKLDENNQTITWHLNGWIIKEIRFMKDERTISDSYYRMGWALHDWMKRREAEKSLYHAEQFSAWKDKATPELAIWSGGERLVPLVKVLTDICQEYYDKLQNLEGLPPAWTYMKRMKYLHFALAFLLLASRKSRFDWKEIGASYYNHIGGSKEFDVNRHEFIEMLEEWLCCPVSLAGLTSGGHITPVFFSGPVSGTYASFHWGPIHSLTDLSIAQDVYSTTAKTVWLVENRAMLTRIASENHFLQKMDSLMICLDGQIRSAHKTFIRQLLQQQTIGQTLIWCDYDQSGLDIARNAYRLVSEFPSVKIKWIGPYADVETSWGAYEQKIATFITERSMEQEYVMGEVGNWTEWINN